MDKKLVILTRWVVLQVMKVSLWFDLFLAKVMGNWGIWGCGLKQLKGERNRNGDKSYWKTMNNNGKKKWFILWEKDVLSPKEKEVGWEENTRSHEKWSSNCGFCHKAEHVFENAQKQEGQEGSKNTSSSKVIFNERIQSIV